MARHNKKCPALTALPISLTAPTRYSHLCPYRAMRTPPSCLLPCFPLTTHSFRSSGRKTCKRLNRDVVTLLLYRLSRNNCSYSSSTAEKMSREVPDSDTSTSRSALFRQFRHFCCKRRRSISTGRDRSTTAEAQPSLPLTG